MTDFMRQSDYTPRLGVDFQIAPLQLHHWVGWLVCLPKETRNGIVWRSYAWREGVEDAIAAGHMLVARKALSA